MTEPYLGEIFGKHGGVGVTKTVVIKLVKPKLVRAI